MIIFLEHFICSKKNTVTLSNLISYEIGYRIHEDAKIKYKASDPAGVGRWLEKDHLWFEMHVVPLWWRPHSVVTWASSNKVKQVWIYSVSTFPLTIKLAIWKCKKKKKRWGHFNGKLGRGTSLPFYPLITAAFYSIFPSKTVNCRPGT